MLIGLSCLIVFLVMAALMYTRRISALLALPIMALVIALVAAIPPADILTKVISQGAVRLHNAYTTTMFGAMLAELVNRQGIARALIRWIAEFSGDNPFVLGILLTLATALLFSTLGGLGAVIMVGTIVLPAMLSLGIPSVTSGALFLFGISLGGMFNLANWQLYIDVLHVERAQIASFVLPFAAVMAVLIVIYLGVELKRLKNMGYIALSLTLIAAGFGALTLTPRLPAVALPESISLYAVALAVLALVAYALVRHFLRQDGLPAIALATPFIPLALVLIFQWEIIPAFLAGIAYGVISTWQKNSVTVLTRSILDGVNAVAPAVILMIGIGILLSAVMHPNVADNIAPLLVKILPSHALAYILIFTVIAPLSLYRGPLSLWGMGSGLVALVKQTAVLTPQAIMGMLMSVGQIQGVCDPTNTHNIWIATYLGTDTQALLRRTIPYVWVGVAGGLSLAVAFGYVPW